MSKTASRDRAVPAAAHDLGIVEYRLRETHGVRDVHARVDPRSARFYWDTWEPNSATRGEVLANVCTAIATSEHWELTTVHDPMERENGLVSNAVTIRRADS